MTAEIYDALESMDLQISIRPYSNEFGDGGWSAMVSNINASSDSSIMQLIKAKTPDGLRLQVTGWLLWYMDNPLSPGKNFASAKQALQQVMAPNNSDVQPAPEPTAKGGDRTYGN